MKTLVCLVLLVMVGTPAFAGDGTPFAVTRHEELKDHIGQRIELVGVVSETKCPQVLGVDLWELGQFHGRRVKVAGILKQYIVTQAQLDKEWKERGPFATRGAGTFYRLTDLHYELQP